MHTSETREDFLEEVRPKLGFKDEYDQNRQTDSRGHSRQKYIRAEA